MRRTQQQNCSTVAFSIILTVSTFLRRRKISFVKNHLRRTLYSNQCKYLSCKISNSYDFQNYVGRGRRIGSGENQIAGHKTINSLKCMIHGVIFSGQLSFIDVNYINDTHSTSNIIRGYKQLYKLRILVLGALFIKTLISLHSHASPTSDTALNRESGSVKQNGHCRVEQDVDCLWQ